MNIRLLLEEALIFEELSLLFENFRLDKIEQMINKRLPKPLGKDKVKMLVMTDPTSKEVGDSVDAGKYAEWIVKQFIQAKNKKIFWEDLYKIKGALGKFHELKTRNKIKGDKKDINQIKDAKELEDLIETEENDVVMSGFPDFRHLIPQHAELIYRDENFNLYGVKDYEAARELGSNTRWCTVPAKHTCDYYLEMGNLYILFSKKMDEIERYQFHFATNQFMDERDRPIAQDGESLNGLIPSGVKAAIVDFAAREKDFSAIAAFGEAKDILKVLMSDNLKPNSFLAIRSGLMKNNRGKILQDENLKSKLIKLAIVKKQIDILVFYNRLKDALKILKTGDIDVSKLLDDQALILYPLIESSPSIAERLRKMGVVSYQGDIVYLFDGWDSVKEVIPMDRDSERQFEWCYKLAEGEENIDTDNVPYNSVDCTVNKENVEYITNILKRHKAEFLEYFDEDDFEQLLTDIEGDDFDNLDDYDSVDCVETIKSALDSACRSAMEQAYESMYYRKFREFVEEHLGKYSYVSTSKDSDAIGIALNFNKILADWENTDPDIRENYGDFTIELALKAINEESGEEHDFDPSNNGYNYPYGEDFDDGSFNEMLMDGIYQEFKDEESKEKETEQ